MATKRTKAGTKAKAAAKKSAAKPAKRATRKSAPKPSAKAARSAGPKPVRTGSGDPPLAVAKKLVDMMRRGQADQVEQKLLAQGIVSVEGAGASMAWFGKKAVLAKYRGWEADHEIHDIQVEGPWVGATGFSVRYVLDVHQKSTGQTHHMEEIAVYTVHNGKITREEFHFRV